MTLLVNLAGLALTVLIVWWFWMTKPQAQRMQSGVVEIVVAEGVYTPARIEVSAGRPVTLRFLRKDPSPCAEKVLLDDLGLSAELPLNERRDLTFTPKIPGEYEFTCEMRMYRGSLVVR